MNEERDKEYSIEEFNEIRLSNVENYVLKQAEYLVSRCISADKSGVGMPEIERAVDVICKIIYACSELRKAREQVTKRLIQSHQSLNT